MWLSMDKELKNVYKSQSKIKKKLLKNKKRLEENKNLTK